MVAGDCCAGRMACAIWPEPLLGWVAAITAIVLSRTRSATMISPISILPVGPRRLPRPPPGEMPRGPGGFGVIDGGSGLVGFFSTPRLSGIGGVGGEMRGHDGGTCVLSIFGLASVCLLASLRAWANASISG